MAKIGQLSPTFQTRGSRVGVGDINLGGLARGLNDASQNYMAALQLRDNARAQRAVVQSQAAAWEMKDFTNAFVLNMDNPQKILDAFGDSNFSLALQGIDANTDLYDSSVGATIYRKAVEASMMQIEDEDAQQKFFYDQMTLWEEGIEPGYQAQANAYIQKEAANEWSGVFNKEWSEGAWSGSLQFNSNLDVGFASGYFGANPEEAAANMAAYKLGYQKAEERAFKSDWFRQNLITAAAEGASEERLRVLAATADFASITAGIKTEGMSEEALNQVIAGGIFLANGGSALTEEENANLTEEWLNRALLTQDLYASEQERYREQIYSAQWEEIYNIIDNRFVDAEGNPVYATAEQRLAAVDAKREELNAMRGTSMGNAPSSAEWMPGIDLGMHDDDELTKMIEKLNTITANGGEDGSSTLNGLALAEQVLMDANLSTDSKSAYLQRLANDGELSLNDFKSFDRRLTTIERMPGFDYASKRITAMRQDGQPLSGLSAAEISQLSAQVSNYLAQASADDIETQKVRIDAITDEFMEDNQAVADILIKSQEEGYNFFRSLLGRGSGENVLAFGSGMTELQKQIEKGTLAGRVEAVAPVLHKYTTEVARRFEQSYVNGLLDEIDTTGLALNESGSPIIVGRMTDITGLPLIAVLRDDVEAPGDVTEGNVPVRIFSPTLGKRTLRQFLSASPMTQEGRQSGIIGFSELTDHAAYIMSATEVDGTIERSILAYTNRTYKGIEGPIPVFEDISIDLEAVIQRQGGLP